MSKVSHTEVGWLLSSHSWWAMGLTCSISRARVLSKMPKGALKAFQVRLAPNLGSHSHHLPPDVSSLSSNKHPAEDFPVRNWDGFLWFICHCERRLELKEKRLMDGSCSLLRDWQLLEQKNRRLLLSGEKAARECFIQRTEGHIPPLLL